MYKPAGKVARFLPQVLAFVDPSEAIGIFQPGFSSAVHTRTEASEFQCSTDLTDCIPQDKHSVFNWVIEL